MIMPCSVWWVLLRSTVEHVAGQFTPKDYGQYKWEGIQITSWGHTCVAGWLALRAYIRTIINLICTGTCTWPPYPTPMIG